MDFSTTAINLISCGEKYGDIPTQSVHEGMHFPIFILDVRSHLPNPHGVSELKGLTGKDSRVQAYILKCPKARQLVISWTRKDQLEWGDKFFKASWGDKWYFICYGGKHRSVAFVEWVAEAYTKAGIPVHVIHRDLQKA